jgi:Lon protease-like protein
MAFIRTSRASQAAVVQSVEHCRWSRDFFPGGRLDPLLALFPLDVVLFPGTPLPLHIFEPRYKEMIGECLEQKKQFGVIRAQETNLADVGCTAEILAVTKTYDDGRMDIVAEGRDRFELLEVNQERAFLRGAILLVQDEPDRPTEAELSHAIELHRQILALANAQQDLPEDQDSALSYHLAGSLPLDLDFKQKLLSLRSEARRIQTVIEYFEGILPSLRHAVVTRRKAGGNGHAN